MAIILVFFPCIWVIRPWSCNKIGFRCLASIWFSARSIQVLYSSSSCWGVLRPSGVMFPSRVSMKFMLRYAVLSGCWLQAYAAMDARCCMMCRLFGVSACVLS